MKITRTFSLLALFSASFISLSAHENRSKSHPASDTEEKTCLELRGKATIHGKAVKDITIRLYRGDNLILEIPSTSKEKVFLALEQNSNYAIAYSRPGYVTRTISFDTHLPASVKVAPIFTFEFDLEMLALDHLPPNLDTDFPVAIVNYNLRNERFECSSNYSNSINKLGKVN